MVCLCMPLDLLITSSVITLAGQTQDTGAHYLPIKKAINMHMCVLVRLLLALV